MSYKKIKTIMLCCLFTFAIQITVNAQEDERYSRMYNKNVLTGKKWTVNSTVKQKRKKYSERLDSITIGTQKIAARAGNKLSVSLTFDKDSLTMMAICEGDTALTRCAYYLSDKYDHEFDYSKVGKDIMGNIINFQEQVVSNGRMRKKHEAARIWEVKDDEIILVMLGVYKKIIRFKAESLKPEDK